MKFARAAVPSLALLLASTAGFAADQPQGGSAQNVDEETVVSGETANDPMSKIECRVEKVIGSRIAKRKRCQTKAQWQAERSDARQAAERVQQMRPKEMQ